MNETALPCAAAAAPDSAVDVYTARGGLAGAVGEGQELPAVAFVKGGVVGDEVQGRNAAAAHVFDDLRSEKLGYKIREAQLQKIPYMLVIGDRDMENGTVSVRTRGGEDLGAMPLDAFIERITGEIKSRSNG